MAEENVRVDVKVETLCPECGALLSVSDPAALIQSLHLVNACEATAEVVGGRE